MAENGAGAGFRRIETLIPYKEPEFRPEAKLGKLDTSNSCWAIASKFGRHLISGMGANADMEGLAMEVAGRLVRHTGELCPVSPEESGLGARLFKRSFPEGSLAFVDEAGEVTVMCPKECKDGSRGHRWWCPNPHSPIVNVTAMSLPCALGALELLGGEPGRLAAVIAGEAEKAREAATLKLGKLLARSEEVDERGMLKVGPFESINWRGSVSACRKWLAMSDAETLGLEDARPETIALMVSMHYESMGTPSPRRWSSRASDVFREMARRTWTDETAREQNREWADSVMRGAHTARVYEDKKNCDDVHRSAAAADFIGREFRHAELDDRCDVGDFLSLERELEARIGSGEVPSVKLADHELRFRLTGRHRATGLYVPLLKSIVVDPRSPSSLLHEFAHAYDFENHQLSTTDDRFRQTVFQPFCEEFETEGLSARQVMYYKTPTEVFARAWESYAFMNGAGGSFVKEANEYQEQVAYAPFLTGELSAAVMGYFDEFAKPTEIVPSLERATGPQARGEWACEVVVSETEDLELDWGDVEVGDQLTLAI